MAHPPNSLDLPSSNLLLAVPKHAEPASWMPCFFFCVTADVAPGTDRVVLQSDHQDGEEEMEEVPHLVG